MKAKTRTEKENMGRKQNNNGQKESNTTQRETYNRLVME